MESSLRVGDYLFVSKAHYGIRTPMTIAMVPLIHNRLPFFNRESYLRSPSLDYYRLPALTHVKRFDPVVFNYPEGDSVYVTPNRTYSLYDVRRDDTIGSRLSYDHTLWIRWITYIKKMYWFAWRFSKNS